MSEFIKLEADSPATLGGVVEAITRVSTMSEARILELVSAGTIKELFPFRPNALDELPPDTVDEGDLIEASAMPLTGERRAALIQASMPSNSRRTPTPEPSQRARKSLSKG